MFIIALIFFLGSTIALGQEISAIPNCTQVNEVFMTVPWFGKVTAAVVSGMGGIRVLAEVLLRLAPASRYGMIATEVAGVIGLFGIGTPKGPSKECPK
jgi:hypothetical protein